MKLNWKLRLFCISSGLLTALSFSTLYTGWMAWFALIPFFYVLYSNKLTPGFGFRCGFWFGISFYIAFSYWLLYLHPLTWLGFSFAESLAIIGGGWILIGVMESIGIWFFGMAIGFYNPKGWQKILIPAIFWIIMEWLQGMGELSMPWVRLVVSQFQYLPMLQISSVTGSILISGLIVAVNAGIVCCIVDREKFHRVTKENLVCLITVIFFIGIISIGGFFVMNNVSSDPKRTIPVTLVQGNFSQSEKWGQGTLDNIVNTYFKLTAEASVFRPKLIVWPESALPVLLKEYLPVKTAAINMTKAYNSYLLTGCFDRPAINSETYFNSAALIGPKEKIMGWYYKRHLVPFGEYLPFRGILDLILNRIEGLNALKHDTSPGTDEAPFSLPFGNIGTLICFESIYPEVARESVIAGSEMIAIITNDGWYKDSIAPYQHNAHAVLRAIENGRYIVRAANTGVSSIIDYHGRILKKTALLTRGYINEYATFRSEITFYTKYGDWLVYLCILLILPLFLINTTRSFK